MQLLDFTEKDYTTLYDFMKPIWLETYAHILSNEQILFLLEKYFALSHIKEFLKSGYVYRKIDNIGVLVYVERETDVYIDKLYLLPCARGKGYPSFVFSTLKKERKKPLALKVNQVNERAFQCYLKNGFHILKEEKIDLGNGMYNVDYIMQLL